MTDVIKLIEADGRVSLLPDASTHEQLRRLGSFWSGRGPVDDTEDLAAASDRALRAYLAEDDLPTDLPPAVLDLVGQKRTPRLVAAAVAASLAAGLGLSIAWSVSSDRETIMDTRAEQSDATDPYLLARPDRPPANSQPSEIEEQRGGLQSASSNRTRPDAALTRAELHDMQRALNRLGYGPLPQDGLESEALHDALARFRRDNGIAPEATALRDILVTLRRAARNDALRAPAATAE